MNLKLEAVPNPGSYNNTAGVPQPETSGDPTVPNALKVKKVRCSNGQCLDERAAARSRTALEALREGPRLVSLHHLLPL